MTEVMQVTLMKKGPAQAPLHQVFIKNCNLRLKNHLASDYFVLEPIQPDAPDMPHLLHMQVREMLAVTTGRFQNIIKIIKFIKN